MQGVWKNCDFRPVSRFISEIIQDRAIVTMEGEYRTQAFEWYQFQWHWVTCNLYFSRSRYYSQGSVATYFRWCGSLCGVYIENFLTNQLVKEFWKSVHISQSLLSNVKWVTFFETQCTVWVKKIIPWGFLNFYRAMLCISAAYAVMRCLYVCLSRSWTVSKRINISSKFFHRRVATPF